MMQGPLAGIMPGGGSVAVGTGTFFSRARPFFDGWCWQIVGMHKFFGRVWLILTGAGHVMIPLEFKVKTDNLPDFSVFVNVNSPILLLQSQNKSFKVICVAPTCKKVPELDMYMATLENAYSGQFIWLKERFGEAETAKKIEEAISK